MNPAKIVSSKPKTYSPSALTNAYLAVKDDGMTVKRVAREFSVPTQTLRDRVLGKVDIDTFAVGRSTVLFGGRSSNGQSLQGNSKIWVWLLL